VIAELLDGRNFVHLATVLPDGGPHSVPVWALREGDRLAFFTQTATRKARNLERDPRVAISVVDAANPYRSAHLRGRVVERLDGDEALAVIDRLSQKYIGAPFPMRQGVVYWVEIERARFVELPFT
jgi:PPOX class probable F420-dependent enzyme